MLRILDVFSLCCIFIFAFKFLSVLYLTICKQFGCQSPTTNTSCSKNAIAFLVNFDSLSFLLSALRASCGLRPHPFAFCKKRSKNFYLFPVFLISLCAYQSRYVTSVSLSYSCGSFVVAGCPTATAIL